jgi:hypothetical protein
MRGFLLLVLGVLFGVGAGIFAGRNEPTKTLIDTHVAPFLTLTAPPPLALQGGQTAFSALDLAPLAIEPCFPRETPTPVSDRPWLTRDVNAQGLSSFEDLPASPDLAAYHGLIKIEGIRSPLGTEREHCAAVRVAEHWFLTAAHCIVDLDIRTARPTFDVIAVTPSADVRSAETQVVRLTGAVCHAAYGMNRQQYPNDVALFYLEDLSAFEDVAIAALEDGARGLIPADFEQTYVAGWGKNGGTRFLQGGAVEMAEIGEAVLIADKVGPKGPNVGDSGAPLYLETDEGPLVIGTLSQVTQDENFDGDRSIYIRTKTVYDWVQRTMAVCEQGGQYVCNDRPAPLPDLETSDAE